MTRQRLGLLVYLVITFAAAWAIELGPVRALGLRSGNRLVIALMAGVMFCPLLGAVAARLVEGRGFGDAGLRWGRGRYLLVAWLLPFGLSLVATALSLALGLGTLDLTAREMVAKLPYAQQVPVMTQIETLGHWFPVIVILSALTQGVLITSIAAFGEEFGWRGYLQVRLGGGPRAMLLTGAIWGLWHAPVILQGHNYPQHPVAGVPLMVVWCMLLGVILGWLFEASGSVIAPALAHASLNSPAAALLVFVAGMDTALGGIVGLVGVGLLGAVALWLWRSGRLGAGTGKPGLQEAGRCTD